MFSGPVPYRSRHFDFVAIELLPDESFQPNLLDLDDATLTKIFQYLPPEFLSSSVALVRDLTGFVVQLLG